MQGRNLKSCALGSSLGHYRAIDVLTTALNNNTMRTAEKAILLTGVLLIFLSLIAVLFFLSLSTIALATRRISHWWNMCFLLNSLALGGWMIFYAAQLRLGGEVVILRNNLMLFWFLVLTVLVSAILRFASPQRYMAILILAVSLVVFHITVPGFLYAFRLIHQR
jgi:hypothetical protein